MNEDLRPARIAKALSAFLVRNGIEYDPEYKIRVEIHVAIPLAQQFKFEEKFADAGEVIHSTDMNLGDLASFYVHMPEEDATEEHAKYIMSGMHGEQSNAQMFCQWVPATGCLDPDAVSCQVLTMGMSWVVRDGAVVCVISTMFMFTLTKEQRDAILDSLESDE